jgi:tRNA(Ile)-lysidine synthase
LSESGKKIKALEDRFREELLRLTGDRAAGGLVVACSGGADSTCLLHLSRAAMSDRGCPLSVAHLDHGLRGEEAVRDRWAVQALAAELGLPMYWEKTDCGALARKYSMSLEEAARKARYSFLEKILNQTGAAFVLTGHTADDQAEGVLLNLLRGAGPKGLAGIPRQRGAILRPLLDFRHQELLEYLETRGLTWVEDQSNQNPSFTRNRIRLDLLPRLERDYNLEIKRILVRTAGIFREEEEFWQDLLQGVKVEAGWQADQGQILMNRLGLSNIAPALGRRLIRAAVEETRGQTLALTLEHVDKVLAVNKGPGGGEVSLPGGLKAWVDAQRLHLGYPRKRVATFSEYGLDCPGETRIPELKATVTATLLDSVDGIDPRGYVGLRTVLDFDSVQPPLTIRGPRPGDRFQPLGLVGTKKLSDIFIDAKVPARQRPGTPLVLDELGIIWVAGYRPAHRARVTTGTGKALVLSFRTGL